MVIQLDRKNTLTESVADCLTSSFPYIRFHRSIEREKAKEGLRGEGLRLAYDTAAEQSITEEGEKPIYDGSVVWQASHGWGA